MLLLWEGSSPWSAGTAVDEGPENQKGEKISVNGILHLQSHQNFAICNTSHTLHLD